MAKENAIIKLKQDLKANKTERLYLFFGDEDYLKDLYVKRIFSLIPDDSFSEFNKITIDAKTADLIEISDALSSFPMMSDKKVVLIEDSGVFKKATEAEKDFYDNIFKNLADDTILIFKESEVDKRSSLYKAASKAGLSIEFNRLNELELVSFIIREANSRGLKMPKDCAEYMVEICEHGLLHLKNEIDKLSGFCQGEITKSDIERIVSKSLETKVFDLCDVLMEKNADKALLMLMDFKTAKVSPFQLLYILFGMFDKMLRAKLMSDSGMTYDEIISTMGLAPFIAKKYINSAKKFKKDELIYMVTKTAETDLLIKQGAILEWPAFEKYVTDFFKGDEPR